MKAYLDLLNTVLTQGQRQSNRTGIDTIDLPGASLRVDLAEGFPAVTTKKLAFKSVIGELVGFLRGAQSAADFRALGCKVWDQNANENAAWLANPYRQGSDDLGPVYGVQWRAWPACKMLDPATQSAQIEDAQARGYTAQPMADGRLLMTKSIDQLADCIRTIVTDPNSRRILFHAWNPAQIEEMALPPCHLLYQFLPNAKAGTLSMTVYIRSNDLGLGLPFNLASAAALLHLVARLTCMAPRFLTIFIGSAHIYVNHLDMVREQLKRAPLPPPTLVLNKFIGPVSQDANIGAVLASVGPEDFALENYQHHGVLTAPMAV